MCCKSMACYGGTEQANLFMVGNIGRPIRRLATSRCGVRLILWGIFSTEAKGGHHDGFAEYLRELRVQLHGYLGDLISVLSTLESDS